jgi:formamidopyrimidine-DNA glycosylase
MPELPEITVIAQQMNAELAGKRIKEIEVKQPKNLNLPVSEFVKKIKGKKVSSVSSKGKWLLIKLDPAYYLLMNLGMGAELLYFLPKQKLPEKYQFKLVFSDGSGFTTHFWWFGYVHLLPEEDLSKHKLTAKLGVSPTEKEFTLEHFKKLLGDRKVSVKSFLLDQKNIAGIGNVYAQDVLFKARLHPNRKISTLTDKEKTDLYYAICKILNYSIKLRGLAYEVDFYGRKGKLTGERFLVGYKTGKPCPECGGTIEKIRTGSTASYICPICQKLEKG